MKKQTLFLSAICGVLLFASCNSGNQNSSETANAEPAAGAEETYTVATDSTSTIKWKGVMLGVKEHFGTISLKEGSIITKGEQLAGGSFTVDMATIKPTDSNYDVKAGYTAEKLVGHLSSPDFFDIPNNPTASFKIDSVSGSEAYGTLTIRGKSNAETVKEVTLKEEGGVLKASGKLTFDRKKYDVAFDMPVKDMVLSNDVELVIELSAKK